MKKMITAAFLLLTFSNSALALNCSGTEPFWNAQISKTEISVQYVGEKKQTYTVEKAESVTGFSPSYMMSYYGMKGPLAVVKKTSCNDGMSDLNFGKETIIFTPEGAISGCCGKAL